MVGGNSDGGGESAFPLMPFCASRVERVLNGVVSRRSESLRPLRRATVSRRAGTMRILWSILLVLIFVPQWMGEPQLPLLGEDRRSDSRPAMLNPGNPAQRRVGDLLWLGGIELRGHGDAFGGFSSLHIDRGRFTLLSDGGNIVSFRLGHHNSVEQVRFAELPGGPGTGWAKYDRDSESMTGDPRTGKIWVGFERANESWRFAPDCTHAEARHAPPAMADWPVNTGAEAMPLLPGGGMLVLDEHGEKRHE